MDAGFEQLNIQEDEKECSCYIPTFFSKHLIKRGVPEEKLFHGIEQHKSRLLNQFEWTNGSIFQQYLQNVKLLLKKQSDTLFNASYEFALHEKNAFQLFFFRLLPLSIISKKIREHGYKTIHKKVAIELISERDGEASVYFTPKPGIVFTDLFCDLNKGATLGMFHSRGYKNVKLTEITCSTREPRARSCHYIVTWSPRPGFIRVIWDIIFLRFRNFQQMVNNFQESQDKLRSQYEETRRLYEQVVKSESGYRRIFENIQDVYFEIAIDGTFVEISPSITIVAAYSREELLNTKLQDLCVETKSLPEILRALQTQERITDYELLIKNKHGQVVPCTITARLLKENSQVQLTGVLRDSTERKRAEEEKQRLQEQLRKSENLQALGRLAGGVAHDFKNQLFGITANARLIKTRCGGDNFLATCADNIINSAYSSSELTKQLLAFARRGRFQSVAIDLHETVKDLVLLLERTLDKVIHIDTRLHAGKTVINGDPSQIENALLNIVFNARDAMPGGGILTFLTEEIVLDEAYCARSEYGITVGRYIKISVRDTGKGIRKEHLDRIFEPFFTTKEFGSGLGLSAVYGTVKEHGGAIEIETMPGAGTTVSLLFPLSSSTVHKKERTGEFLRSATHKNLLLVDDEEIVRNGAKAALEQVGFGVYAFSNGGSALQHYKENHGKIHLVILDMILPDQSVQELFDNIQCINPRARIVLWSAFTLPEIVQSLRQKGALDFIDKDCNINGFVKRILDLVE